MGPTSFYNIAVAVTATAAPLRAQLLSASRSVDQFYAKVITGANASAAANAKATAAMMSMGQAAKLAVPASFAVGLAMSVKHAAQFEQRMRNVNSLLKVSQRDFQSMSDAVVALSREVPQTANQLAEGMYEIASAGFEGAEAFEVLKASAYAASAGMSDTDTAVKAISATINAYRDENLKASYVSDVLFQTVNLGIITFEELALQLGDVVGMAAAANVSIAEVGSAMATMTLAGLQASEAAVSLNRLIRTLVHPHRELAGALQAVGYESGALALEQDGLKNVMTTLSTAVGGNITQMLQLFPEIRAARGALALLAAEGMNYTRVSEGIENAEGVRNATMKAFNEQMRGTLAQFQLFKNQATAVAIQVGQQLLPAMRGLMNILASAVNAFGEITSFMADNREMVIALAAVYSTKLIPAISRAFNVALFSSAGQAMLGFYMNLGMAMKTAGGIGKIGAGFNVLKGAVASVNPVMLAFAAGAAAVAFGMNRMRKQMESNDKAIEHLSRSSEQALANIDRIYDSIINVTEAGKFDWSDLMAWGNADTVRVNELATEFDRLAQNAPEAALELLAFAEAQGLIAKNSEGDYVGIGDSAIKGVAATREEVEALSMALTAQQQAALDNTRTFGGMGSAGLDAATQMSGGIGMNIDDYIELIERVEEFGLQVRETYAEAGNIVANFDPTAAWDPSAGQRLGDQLQENFASAQDALDSAQRGVQDVMRAQEDARYNLAEANRSLSDAQNEIGRVAQQNARAVEDANRRIADANEALADSHGAVQDAQENLSEARREAAEYVQELRESLEGQADSEEKALIAVAKARAELAGSMVGGDALSQREAALALREAERALEGTRKTGQETREELEELERVGVEGSENVIAAREKLAEAEERVADAAVAVRDAQREASEVVLQNATNMENAYRRVEQATRGVADAQRGIEDAALAEANAFNELMTASQAYNEALLRLEDPTHAAREFVEQTREAQTIFNEGIQELIEQGLDPAIIEDLLLAGPERANPIIESMLSDHTGVIIEIANEAQTELETMADTTERMARIVARANEAQTSAMVDNMTSAMRVAEETARQGTEATTASVARALRIGLGEARALADSYGILLLDSANAVNEAIGAPLIPTPNQLTQSLTGSAGGIGGSNGVMGPIPGYGANGFAYGGHVKGWSPNDKADNIPAWLTANEFVQPVNVVDYYGVDSMEAIRRKQVPRELLRGYAGGGQVRGDTQGLHPEFLARLQNWSLSLGQSYTVGSGYRSIAEQAILYDRWVRRVPGQAPAAPPGRSMHNFGLASDGDRWRNKDPEKFGLRYPMDYEPWHIEPVGARSMRDAMIAGGITGDMFGHSLMMAPAAPAVPTEFNNYGLFGDVTSGVMGKLRDNVQEYMNRRSFMPYSPDGTNFDLPGGTQPIPGNLPSTVTRWAGTVEQALETMGQPLNYLGITLRRMNQESSGRPDIVNRWDSNWRKGTPSVGLMQVIGPTYAANKHPQFDTGPYLYGTSINPMANILASMRYALGRYGNLPSAYNRSGGYAAGGLVVPTYDTGGQLPPGLNFIANNTGKPEAIFPIDTLATHILNLGNAISVLHEEITSDHYERPGMTPYRRPGSGPAPEEMLELMIEGLNTAHGELIDMVIAASNAGSSLESMAGALDILRVTTTSAGEAMGFVQGVTSGVRQDAGVTGALAGQIGENSSSAEIQATIQAIQELEAAWERADQEAAITAQRDALWEQIRLQEAVLEAARKAEEAATTDQEREVLADVREQAEEQLGEAINATIEFDREAARAAEERAMAEQVASLEIQRAAAEEREEFEAMIEANRDEWHFARMSTEDQIKDLSRRLAATQAFTDEWMDLWSQRENLMREEARNQERAADDMLSALNRALDQYEALIKRRDDAQAAYDKRVEDAVDAYEKRLEGLREGARDQMDQIRKDRADFLTETFKLDQPVEVTWGNTAAAINANQRNQMDLLRQWASGLDQLRQRGLSEEVIAALNLDDPNNLGQIQMFLGEAQTELEQMNTLYQERLAFARGRAAHEQENLLGAVGEASIEVQDKLRTAIDELYLEHEKALDQLEVDLTTELKEIADEIELIGTDTGRTYSEALALALESGLGPVIEMARQYEQALADAQAAADSVENLGSTNPGVQHYVRDQGGILPPGLSTIYNGTGRNEYILNHQQMAATLAARAPSSGGGAMTIEVHMDGRVIAQTVTEYQHRGNRKIILTKGNVLQGVK